MILLYGPTKNPTHTHTQTHHAKGTNESERDIIFQFLPILSFYFIYEPHTPLPPPTETTTDRRKKTTENIYLYIRLHFSFIVWKKSINLCMYIHMKREAEHVENGLYGEYVWTLSGFSVGCVYQTYARF